MSNVEPIPEGYETVTPSLSAHDGIAAWPIATQKEIVTPVEMAKRAQSMGG